ncbi:tannase and feruloyl esterase [Paraphaeosphaeria sporulosa]|uniref:Carboxylic ester hydrolase n=1 Tax=Paraphaeosphaeria sporulosa TaxID=1460663 RepID=A0A177C5Z5_9PLEO|nr:tannase and feruloyl esterase [Paraphaeosphaeria sporulosa]OAG02836.1 tannase and feruloyl esterase [Paraphaeosphaeria sporulosa]
MRHSLFTTPLALAVATSAATLEDLCTVENVQSALPADGTILGIDLLPDTVTAAAVYNASTGGGMMKRQAGGSTSSATYSYCNVTVSYTHTGKNDTIPVIFALPQPSDFKNRFYLGGGGGFSLSSSATGGLSYGAASGATSAGYDAFNNAYDAKVLYGNGSINWDATYAFGYTALGELTSIGKPLSQAFYGSGNGTKLYTYFEGCSDGGREGMSQVQRWGEEYDGVVAGAPAFRFAQQQVTHVLSSAIEHTMDYYPPPCALKKIVNATIDACDSLDGRTDGVVSRTDLCMLNFNLSSIVGEAYYCAAQSSTSLGFGFSKRQAGPAGSTTSYQPAQNGTVNANDIAVAQGIYDGLFNSQGQRAYVGWQIGSELSDATTTWDNDTNSWALSIPSTGGEYVTKFVQLLNLDNLSDLEGVTYDTLVDWMNTGMIRYMDSLQTTLPDLRPFQSSGGKLLHYHGESDPSIPSASSVHYWQSVRSIMYANATDEEAQEAMSDWYQFYLIPGYAHCGSNSLQPNGPAPQDNMATIIDWVENGIKPSHLNATVSSGDYAGEVQKLCQWPQRPKWSGNSTDFECETDEASIESWTYTFDAFKLPVY